MPLKLSPVRAVMRRGISASALVIALFLVLQSSDLPSAIEPSDAQEPFLPAAAPFGMSAGGGDADFFASQRWVIPLGRRSISVPILMYHYIRTPPSPLRDRVGYNLSVSPADFQIQMNWLWVHGYHPVDFNDLRAYFDGRRVLPGRPVVITLDDGYKDLYTAAYPILREFNFKAVAYIVSGFVGEPRYVTAPQVQEMDQEGVEIASHTVDHADLARASLSSAMYQLVVSRAWLQHLVGHSVVDFAYPSGRFNAQVAADVRAAGYDTAVTEIPGTYHSLADRYTWTRVRVAGGESLAAFIKNLGPVEPMVEVPAVGSP